MNESDLRLAEGGDAEAQYRVARWHAYGGGNFDEQEALKWYQKAAEQGHADSQHEVAISCQRAAEQGQTDPQFDIYSSHHQEEMEQHNQECVKWHLKAAEQGHSDSQYALVFRYQVGHGVPQDKQEAFKWCTKAAEQGYSPHQIELAEMYQDGNGVTKDTGEAVKWFRKAAEQGNGYAQLRLASGSRSGRLPKNLKESLKWHLILAKEGNMDSQCSAGIMYLDGEGTPESYIDAYAWLSLAKTQGHDFAGNELEALKPKMTNQQIADGQALAARYYDSIYKDCD